MKQSPDHLPDFDNDLERDSVWNLVDDATSYSPSPRFMQDTLRRARLETQTSSSWWEAILATNSPARFCCWVGASVASSAAVAAVAFTIALQPDPIHPPTAAAIPPAKAVEWDGLEDALASQLLEMAAEESSLLSDDEIVTLLF